MIRPFLCLLLAVATAGNSRADDGLGDISFPTSGAPAAQPAFLEGVKALHSFQFDEARVAFQRARQTDPDFAMAHWGEAMSLNKPLWRLQDTDEARRVLASLAPTLEGRLARAGDDRERAWLAAVDLLFHGPADKLERDLAYSAAMGAMHERWPDDDEIAVFYALSILGTMRPGDTGYRRQARAAAVCLDVFARNPRHPGAAHFIIHSFDDPEHAVLALPAARVYAGIAPAAAHALHMPSHIFLQLGLWQDVVASNTEAYAAAVELNRRMNLPEGREDFHTLSWLAYGNLMLGRVEAAADNLGLARAAVARNPGERRIEERYFDIEARHYIETGRWPELGLASIDSVAGSHPNRVALVGMSAARRGDFATAAAARERLLALGAAAAEDYERRRVGVLERQVAALAAMGRGDESAALEFAAAAVAGENTLGIPSGPPDPIKPAGELYGELLFEAGRAAEAAAAFEQALERMPRRTPSLAGLARAAERAGDSETAEAAYASLATMPGLQPDSALQREARERLD